MPITTGNFAKLLWPGLNAIYGHKYNEYPEESKMIFETKGSHKAFEEDVGITGFGTASVKTEGNPIGYDTEQQGFLTRYNHVVYGLGFIITEEMMDDDQYDTVGQRRTEGLAYSMRVTKEIVAANVLNRAFNVAYVGGDNASLIASVGGGGSVSHPNVSGGSWTNGVATAADLSEAALEQAVIDIGNFLDDRGKQMKALPKKLIIKNDLQFEAQRILESILQSGSANHDINAMRSMGAIPEVVINHYLTDVDAWFILTDVPNGMTHFERKAAKFAADNDHDTSNAKFKCTERYSFGWTDPRCLYGSPGA